MGRKLACLAPWLCVFLSCAGDAASQPPRPSVEARHPVLLVGIDGLEWEVVLPMVRDGRLPTLAGLMKRGAFGKLATAPITLSPIIWSSVATGVSEDQHGIRGFLCGSAEGVPRTCTSLDRKVKALWHIVTDHGLRTHVVGWWVTDPVEPIGGVMVAPINTKKAPDADASSRRVYPAERSEQVRSVVRRVDATLDERVQRIFGEAALAADPIASKLWKRCTWAFRADSIYGDVALELLADREAPADLFLVYFGATDLVGHRFWRYYRPELYTDRPTAEQLATFSDIIPDYYAEIDRVLGELVAAAPPETNVLVLSDHGMRAVNVDATYTDDRPTKELRSGGHDHAPPGVFVAAGPDIRRPQQPPHLERLLDSELSSVGSILDIAPTVLALVGLPVGRDMKGRVLEDVFAAKPVIEWVATHTPADWHETRARPEEVVEDPAVDAERLEQLRSLGYID